MKNESESLAKNVPESEIYENIHNSLCRLFKIQHPNFPVTSYEINRKKSS